MENFVLLGLPCGSGYFPHQTVLSLLTLHKKNCTLTIVPRMRVDYARNEIVRQALEQDCTHILMVDDDNPIPPDTFDKMIAADKDIICAPIRQKIPPHKVCCYEIGKEDDTEGYKNLETMDTSKGHLVKIDACGMGCTMIKRKVFKTLYEKYNKMPFEF